jgi:hypothetical protein
MNDATTKMMVPRMMVCVMDGCLVKSISCGNGGIKYQYGEATVHFKDVLTGCCKKDDAFNEGGVDSFIRQHQTITTTLPAALHDGLISTSWLPALQPVVTLTLVTAFEATEAMLDAWHRRHNARITRDCATIGRKNGEHDSCSTNEAS